MCLAVQAQATLVRSFKRLRGDDAAPGTQSAYRITVRQLEALVRLSEAMARVYLSSTVTAEHVAEVGDAAGHLTPVRAGQVRSGEDHSGAVCAPGRSGALSPLRQSCYCTGSSAGL